MASSYTTSLKIQEIGNGEQSSVWGSTTNTNWTLIEQAVAGVQTITMANANYTLTNLNGVLDEARNMVLVVQGTNSGIYQVIIPANQPKMYVIYNNTTGGYGITIGTTGVGGTLISIPNGVTAQVYTDGTNTYSAQTGSAGNFNVNGTLTASGITDTGALSASSLTVSGAASLAATSFSVSPTAPTPTTGDNSTQLATTAFVNTATSGLGTMASQNANAVAITGGNITGLTTLGTTLSPIASSTIGSLAVTTSLQVQNSAAIKTTLQVGYGGTTGVIYLSSNNVYYLQFDGTNYNFGGTGATNGLNVTGNIATSNGQFSGAGTGLTGTATSLSIGGNAATATTATTASNGGVTSVNGNTGAVSLPIGILGQVFTSSGTFTIPTGVTALKVTVVGGGGSGVGLFGYCCPTIINGNAGGTSSVSSGTQTISTVSATGGGAGTGSVGGGGGLGSGGDLNMNGNSAITSGISFAGGSLFSSAYNNASGAGKSYGGGSIGASGNTSGGGGGTAIKYLTGLTPGATLTVTRGAGGAGAVSTSSSGAGGNGVIIFEW